MTTTTRSDGLACLDILERLGALVVDPAGMSDRFDFFLSKSPDEINLDSLENENEGGDTFKLECNGLLRTSAYIAVDG